MSSPSRRDGVEARFITGVDFPKRQGSQVEGTTLCRLHSQAVPIPHPANQNLPCSISNFADSAIHDYTRQDVTDFSPLRQENGSTQYQEGHFTDDGAAQGSYRRAYDVLGHACEKTLWRYLNFGHDYALMAQRMSTAGEALMEQEDSDTDSETDESPTELQC